MSFSAEFLNKLFISGFFSVEKLKTKKIIIVYSLLLMISTMVKLALKKDILVTTQISYLYI